MKKALIVMLALAVSPLFTWAQGAFAPNRNVTIVVPFPPGGGTDALARILAEKLSLLWKQPVVVENRAGAQGNIGTAYAAKAAPDGHTLALAHQGVFTVNPHLYKDAPFDPLKDLRPVSRSTQQPFVLVAHPSLPANSVKELVALAKSQPGKLSYGSSASGPQLAGEMFKAATQVDMLHVAYKGAGPAVVDLLAGHIPLMVANPTSVAPHVRSGKLKALVLLGKDPLDVLPGTPTAEQAGYPSLGDMPEWYGFAVPAATPSGVVQQLNKDLHAALNDPSVQARIRALGLIPSTSSPEEFSEQIHRDYQSAARLVKLAGIEKQ
jgi:tripartite-type tricarboxylate transporter receptor subunit TctC